MRSFFKIGVMALCVAAGVAAATPRAEAAAYLTAAGWNAALGGAVAEYGDVTLSQLPTYTVEYRDSFGTWRPGEPNAVLVGTAGYPYTNPGAVQSRPFITSYGGSTLGSQFTCFSPTFQCLGAYRVTFTFPYEIIGFSGQLSMGGDILPLESFGELQIPDYVASQAWRSGATFYGRLLDQPTNSFAVTWANITSTGVDGTASFAISNAVVLRAGAATAVPEPASIALFGMGLAGLGMVARRRR